MTKCRFYGKSHVALALAGLLIDQLGNECAAIEDSYAPCHREIAGEPIDEKTCPLAMRQSDPAAQRRLIIEGELGAYPD